MSIMPDYTVHSDCTETYSSFQILKIETETFVTVGFVGGDGLKNKYATSRLQV